MAIQRLLVIANETIDGAALHQHIHDLIDHDGEVIVVVPALSSRLKYIFSDVDEPRAHARELLEASLGHLRANGIDAVGAIGDANPVLAFEDAVAMHRPDGVLIATHPEAQMHWIEHHEVERIRLKTNLPVEHAVVEAAPTEHLAQAR